MNAEFAQVHPTAQSRQILALAKKLAGLKPTINRAWNA
jgi:hypothetical protein